MPGAKLESNDTGPQALEYVLLAHVILRLALSNKPGVNDVFADTLWSLNWLSTNFQLGFHNINFYVYPDDNSVVHTTIASQPNAATRYTALAEPGYYALYTFSRYAQGKAILATVVTTRANVKAYAVRDGKAFLP